MYAHIKFLIGKDRTSEALNALSEILEADPRLYDLIYQSGRYNNLQAKSREGLISYQDANLEANKIRKSILDLVEELESDPLVRSRRRIKQVALITSGLLLMALLIIGINQWMPDQTINGMEIHDISIETHGEQSPAIISSDKVEINFGSEASGNEREKTLKKKSPSSLQIEGKTQLKTEGAQSPSVISGDEVTISYDTDWEALDTTATDSTQK